jgi:hypothetical protein
VSPAQPLDEGAGFPVQSVPLILLILVGRQPTAGTRTTPRKTKVEAKVPSPRVVATKSPAAVPRAKVHGIAYEHRLRMHGA